MIRNEFRLSNLVLRADGWSGDKATMFSEHPYEIDSLDFKYAGIHDFPDFKGCMDVEYKDLKGIELTEEWLIKFGFEKINHTSGYSFYSLKRKRNENKPVINIYETYTRIGNNSSAKHCKYVHQLQNLYFALIGKELIIK